MKTDGLGGQQIAATVMWSNNVELAHLSAEEECLPVIGSSQVSSILSTLDVPEKVIDIPANMELIVLQNTNFKVPQVIDGQSQTKNPKNKELTYIMCDLCPFLCLKEKKIAEHIELVHKSKKPSEVFEMKCPACPNMFYHKLSLQAHLTYDHCVTNNADIAKIIQIALHTKKSTTFVNKLAPLVIDIDKTPILIEGIGDTVRPLIHCKNEVDLKYGRPIRPKPDVLEGIVLGDIDVENDTPEPVNLPVLEMSQNSAEKMFTNYIKQPAGGGGIAKFLDDSKAVKCKVENCKVRMHNLDKLEYHTQCHVDSIYKCHECGKMFSVWKTLAGHLWRTHKIDMELYCCDKCEYRTASLSSLNNTHKLIHGSTKNFACDVCQKSFKNAKQLRNHKDTHRRTSENSFTCKECGKSFASNHQLKTHSDGVHKKLKPYLCNYCGYKGATRGGLKMHVRQHTGEKPFSCDKCDYSTADHNSLRRHKLGHAGAKPYKCPKCEYQCIQTSTYKVHINTKHPGLDKELLYSCNICQFRSVNKDVYNSHMVSQHPNSR